MLLIISERSEYTTYKVIEWLRLYGTHFIRVNPDDFLFFSRKISNEGNSISIKLNGVELTNADSVWLRRGGLAFFKLPFEHPENSSLVANRINNHLFNEIRVLQEDFHNEIEKNQHDLFSSFFNNRPNKLIVLRLAADCGLKIPPTIVSNSKVEILKFIEENGQCIIKSINNNISIDHNKINYCQYTTTIDSDEFAQLYNDYVFPAIVQKNIIKKLEVRAFILEKKVYSMAIFSQEEQKTSLDYRNSNLDRNLRCVPFALPFTIESSLLNLFERLQLNSGSVDLIYTQNKEFYFLEVNPVGQFGMVSAHCNYYLEKKVAKYFSV